MGILSRLPKHFVNKFDAFGINVGLYYRGESKYKTTFGACCTIFLTILLIAFTVLNVLSMNWPVNVPMTQLQLTSSEPTVWNPIFEDNMKIAFAMKGGIEQPRQPFDDDQIVPTFVHVKTEYGVAQYKVIPLNPCSIDDFDGIDDISVLEQNGFENDNPIENLLCPDFDNEEDPEADAISREDYAQLSQLQAANTQYMAFVVRAKAVNNTYMSTVRVHGYASTTNIRPDDPNKHTSTYMREIFVQRLIASQPKTMLVKVRKDLAEGFEPDLLNIVRKEEPKALHTVQEA